MNEERNEKIIEDEEVLENVELTDDEAAEISGGLGHKLPTRNVNKGRINKC